jgi:hypothetical protein
VRFRLRIGRAGGKAPSGMSTGRAWGTGSRSGKMSPIRSTAYLISDLICVIPALNWLGKLPSKGDRLGCSNEFPMNFVPGTISTFDPGRSARAQIVPTVFRAC